MRTSEPGTAVVTKGEPSAKDMARLRLDLSDHDREQLREYLARGPAPATDRDRRDK
jgi:hypothetical protein